MGTNLNKKDVGQVKIKNILWRSIRPQRSSPGSFRGGRITHIDLVVGIQGSKEEYWCSSLNSWCGRWMGNDIVVVGWVKYWSCYCPVKAIARESTRFPPPQLVEWLYLRIRVVDGRDVSRGLEDDDCWGRKSLEESATKRDAVWKR